MFKLLNMGIVDTLTNFKMQLNIPSYKQNNWFESFFFVNKAKILSLFTYMMLKFH